MPYSPFEETVRSDIEVALHRAGVRDLDVFCSLQRCLATTNKDENEDSRVPAITCPTKTAVYANAVMMWLTDEVIDYAITNSGKQAPAAITADFLQPLLNADDEFMAAFQNEGASRPPLCSFPKFSKIGRPNLSDDGAVLWDSYLDRLLDQLRTLSHQIVRNRLDSDPDSVERSSDDAIHLNKDDLCQALRQVFSQGTLARDVHTEGFKQEHMFLRAVRELGV